VFALVVMVKLEVPVMVEVAIGEQGAVSRRLWRRPVTIEPQ
jgi:hypothetical protein